MLYDEGFVEPVLVGASHPSARQLEWVTPSSHGDDIDQLTLAARLLNKGEVDAVIAGALSPSANVLQVGIKQVGLTSTGVLSSYFLMVVDNRLEAYADCAVIPQPTSEQLARIAIDTADNFKELTNLEPKMAFLSFSTLGSAKHHSIDRIKEAVRLAQEARPNYLIDGELQFDAAYAAAVAQRKAPHSEVAGNANVYIFPDLEAGNIAYKVAERLGGTTAIGPILQGLNKPWLDLSRGCSANDIFDLALIAGAMTYSVEGE